MNARIVVFAYSDVGYACLKLLLDRNENVVAVYTHADKPGENVWFPSVERLARERGLPVYIEENLRSAQELERLRSLKPDLLLSFYYRNLIPVEILQLARLGAYNMHGSLLPLYRGRAPINWAVLNGETKTGATLHAMVEKADAGDIVDQQQVGIAPNDTAAIVQAGVTQAAVRILGRQIDPLKNGTARLTPQDVSTGSYFGRRRPEDGAIEWSWPAQRIHNLVRAVTHPYPGAFGQIFGEKFFIWSTRMAARSAGTRKPGDVFSVGNQMFVACGQGTVIELVRLQRENKQEQSASEFILKGETYESTDTGR